MPKIDIKKLSEEVQKNQGEMPKEEEEKEMQEIRNACIAEDERHMQLSKIKLHKGLFDSRLPNELVELGSPRSRHFEALILTPYGIRVVRDDCTPFYINMQYVETFDFLEDSLVGTDEKEDL